MNLVIVLEQYEQDEQLLIDEEWRAGHFEVDGPAGRDLSGPDVQSSNAPTGKVMDQEGDRIQPDPVLRQDYRCRASTLELTTMSKARFKNSSTGPHRKPSE